MGKQDKATIAELKEFLWQQFCAGNIEFKKSKVDKRKIKGQREPKNISEALLELFFYHWLDKWTIRGAIVAAMKTPDFKIIYKYKKDSMKNNPKKKEILDKYRWFDNVVRREFKNEDTLHKQYLTQKGPLMQTLLKKVRKQRKRDKKDSFYDDPGKYGVE